MAFREVLKYTFPDLWSLGLQTGNHWAEGFFHPSTSSLGSHLMSPLASSPAAWESHWGCFSTWRLSPS